MAKAQWEYCQLETAQDVVGEHETWGSIKVPVVIVRYYDAVAGAIIKHIRRDELKDYDQTFFLEKIIGLLGKAGWEMVSVHHAVTYEPQYGPARTEMDAVFSYITPYRIIYFKRPVVPGRGVDQPELSLT